VIHTTERPAPQLAFNATRCAICGTINEADELYPATLEVGSLASTHFSARRPPDGVHHRIARCRRCGLVRSDPVLDGAAMAELYRLSTFDYGAELSGLKVTYGKALDRLAELVPSRAGLLDIGCGNGFVLSLALERGWKDVRGVEPSEDAISQSNADTAPLIVQDMMRPDLFEPESLDAITLFQVLDHISEPNRLLQECHRLLRPGGAILALNHSVTSWSSRLLGERSPIIDVEHTYLYSPRTMRILFEQAGFQCLTVKPVTNTYSAAYLCHLLPLPARLKRAAVAGLRRSLLGGIQLTLPLGNLRLIARRPG
jgi:SAM-dependent methyltransferase